MFTGFTDKTFDFLFGIFLNNERLWFEAHKEDYKNHLLRPMTELSHEVFDQLTHIFPGKDLICRVARIYKDARRYHGISPYKESLWFTIRGPAEGWADCPTFWFELMRDSWSYGLGFYEAKSATMSRHRALIDRAPGRLQQLHSNLLGQTEFTLQGTSYARFKPCASTPLAGWYNYKNFSILHESDDFSPLYDGPALVARLMRGFRFLMPYYDYFYPLCEAAQDTSAPLRG